MLLFLLLKSVVLSAELRWSKSLFFLLSCVLFEFLPGLEVMGSWLLLFVLDLLFLLLLVMGSESMNVSCLRCLLESASRQALESLRCCLREKALSCLSEKAAI